MNNIKTALNKAQKRQKLVKIKVKLRQVTTNHCQGNEFLFKHHFFVPLHSVIKKILHPAKAILFSIHFFFVLSKSPHQSDFKYHYEQILKERECQFKLLNCKNQEHRNVDSFSLQLCIYQNESMPAKRTEFVQKQMFCEFKFKLKILLKI